MNVVCLLRDLRLVTRLQQNEPRVPVPPADLERTGLLAPGRLAADLSQERVQDAMLSSPCAACDMAVDA